LQNQGILKRMEDWKIQSPESAGFYTVITPEKNECNVAHMYRLNLPKGQEFVLESGKLEMHAVLIQGVASLSAHCMLGGITMKRFDSFYISAFEKVVIHSKDDCMFYIAGGPYEGIGECHFRAFNPELPIGDVHQIHGSGVGRREVMFTLPPQTPASRLICGLTWGGEGTWTSWPPHQHEQDLEEVYCYFDMDSPKFGFHISYLESGKIEDGIIHVVRSGTVVQVPKGYHPTVASPGTKIHISGHLLH